MGTLVACARITRSNVSRALAVLLGSVGLDTTFVCYLEDLERNKDNKQYCMEPVVHDHLQERANQTVQ